METPTLDKPRINGDPDIDHGHAADAPEQAPTHGFGIPLNLANIEKLPEHMREDVLWLHGYASANGWDRDRLASEVGYHWSNIWKLFNGKYEGNLRDSFINHPTVSRIQCLPPKFIPCASARWLPIRHINFSRLHP